MPRGVDRLLGGDGGASGGGFPIYERSESASPLERAAGAKILGAKAVLLDF